MTKPQIVIRRPRSTTGGDVPEVLAKAGAELGPLLLPCYQKALEMRPSLRGTLVLGVKLGPDGSVEESRMELSSLGDEFLAVCAAAKVGKAKSTEMFGSKDDRRGLHTKCKWEAADCTRSTNPCRQDHAGLRDLGGIARPIISAWSLLKVQQT